MPSKLHGIVAKANSSFSVQLAAVLLAGSSLLSSLLGLYRDRLLNGTYLATYPVGIDAYTVAFLIPDLVFFLLISGAISVTFIPVFNERWAKGNKRSAWRLSSSLINFMSILAFAAGILIMIFAEPLVNYVVAPGLDEAGRGLAVSMMRVLAINPLLFAISSIIASMQQAVGRFFFFAMAPVLYNIGVIFGVLVLSNGISFFGVQVFEGGIMGVALGAVLGALLQLVFSCIGLISMGFDYEFKIHWKNEGFRTVLRLLPPRSVDQGIDYINSIVETNLASRLAEGSVRVYQLATTLHLMPVTLIGVAISTAAFPQMSARLGQGRPDLFKKELRAVIRVIVWIALPATVLFFLGRGYIASFIVPFQEGVPAVAGVLGVLVFAILFRSIYHIAARSFYAQQDTKTPLYISLFTIGLNIVLAIWLGRAESLGLIGLAMAQSIVAFVEVVILFSIMQYRLKRIFNASFAHAIFKMLIASVFMFVATYIAIGLFPLEKSDESFFQVFPKFIIIAFIGGLVYLLASRLLRLRESYPILDRINRIVFKQFQPVRSGRK